MIARQTELDCPYYGCPTVHTVLYASLYIKRIICQRCAHVVARPALLLVLEYYCDLS